MLLVFITFIFYKSVFFPPELLESRKTQKIQLKTKLPVIEKEKLYFISDLKNIPENSIVRIKGKIVQLKKEKDKYTGIIDDSTGKINFVLYKEVLNKNETLPQIIDDAVFLDITFIFLVKVKDGYVEVLDAI